MPPSSLSITFKQLNDNTVVPYQLIYIAHVTYGLREKTQILELKETSVLLLDFTPKFASNAELFLTGLRSE